MFWYTESMLEQQAIPEYYPTVVMDIRLGKKYSSIEFDYEAYTEECSRQEIPLDRASELTIKLDKGFGFTHGQFNATESEVRIKTNRFINKSMAHEMSHVTDWYRTGQEMSYWHRLCTNGIAYSTYIGIGAISITNADRLFDIGIDNNTLVGVDIGILLGMGMFLLGYSMETGERAARKAAKESQKNFFQTIKR